MQGKKKKQKQPLEPHSSAGVWTPSQHSWSFRREPEMQSFCPVNPGWLSGVFWCQHYKCGPLDEHWPSRSVSRFTALEGVCSRLDPSQDASTRSAGVREAGCTNGDSPHGAPLTADNSGKFGDPRSPVRLSNLQKDLQYPLKAVSTHAYRFPRWC